VKYLECAKQLSEHRDIFVISALHKLVPLDTMIECYDYTLKNKSYEEINSWGKSVAKQLEALYDLNNTKFIIIADNDYCLALKPYLPNIDMPLNGVGCGPDGYNQLDAYVNTFLAKNNTKVLKGL